MADNVTTDPGALGAVFATDDIGGVHYPITKLTFGALDAQVIASAGEGAIDAGCQRVTIATDDDGVAHLATIAGDTTSLDAAVYVDDADWTDSASKHILVGGLYQSAPQTITDGDVGPIQVDANGNVVITGTVTANLSATDNTVLDNIATSVANIDTNLGGTHVDDAAFTAATSDGVPAMGFFSADTVDAGDAGCLAMDASRRLLVSIEVDNASIGGGTEYTEDAAAAADPVGGVQILVRDDTPVSIAADGDNVARRGTEYGAAYSQIVDSSGNFIDAFSGGTQYTEDVATANPIVGTATMMERDDALGGLTPAEGDWASLRCDANGALWVIPHGTTTVDGTVTANPASGTIDTVTNLAQMAGTAISIGTGARDGGCQRITVATDDIVPVKAASGSIESGAVASGAIASGAVASGAIASGAIVAGAVAAGATSFVKLEDVASAAADAGVPAMARRTATPADTSGADLDYEMLQMDNGRLWTTAGIDTLGGTAISMDEGAVDGGTQRVSLATDDDGVAHLATIAGDTTAIQTAVEIIDNPIVAHDAAISGSTGVNVIGARAVASVEGQTETAAADASQVNATLSGNLITQAQVAPEELVSFYVANTDGAEDAVTGLDAGGATVWNYITSVTVHNAHATTNGFVTLLDGTGGSIFWVFPAPALGGTTMNFNPPLKQKTVNTALYVDVSAAITTMYISIAGYQGQG